MLFRHDSEAAPQRKGAPCVERNVYVTNTGLLLRYHSHVDSRYQHGLLVTMLDHAHRLSSSWAHFSEEREQERFSVSCGIRITLLTPLSTGLSPRESQWASLLDQDAAVTVKRQLRDLSSKVPVFTRRKLKQDLSPREPKSNIVTQQCVAYLFQRVLCYASYVGYPKGHLHTRVEGYRQKASSIYKHYYKGHTTAVPNNFLERNA